LTDSGTAQAGVNIPNFLPHFKHFLQHLKRIIARRFCCLFCSFCGRWQGRIRWHIIMQISGDMIAWQMKRSSGNG
jgi:hypothetical protein